MPSLRPRSFPPSSWTTGGVRLGLAVAAPPGRRWLLLRERVSANARDRAADQAVVVPSIFRRFMRPNGSGLSFVWRFLRLGFCRSCDGDC